jgi:nitrous oxidase accessory protein NosD
MTTYYVATNGSDKGNGSAHSPWRTISKAMKANLKPGDDVVVRSGTYKEAVVVKEDGAAGKYITIRSEKHGGAKIDPPGDKPGIFINADYVTIDGFNVSGSKASGITGIGVHHVEVTDNIVHDNVSNGIFLGKFDFATIEGNVVYGNAAKGASSGIHLKGAHSMTGGGGSDGGYRIIVRDNVSYGNKTKYGPKTDGSGISLDDFQNLQIKSFPPYQFKSLVEDNIVYSNTGRGIQIAWSDHVTIRDNISMHNNADGRSGLWLNELANMGSHNNTWTGNIAVTDRGNPAIGNVSFGKDRANKNVSWHDNITFNGKQGDDSIYANAGNSLPHGNGNKLGSNPGLSLSELKQMAAALTGKAAAASASAETLAVKATGVTAAGADDDDFVFHVTSKAGKGQADEIRDVSYSQGDEIDLSGIDANIKVSGNQAFSYIGTKEFSGKSGQLKYEDGVVAGDLNGDKAADFQIEIANDHGLGAGDFLL